jgi:hypothetical protein
MEYKTINWDRQELYEAVWQKPTVQLAKEYGISDVALSKICRKLDIPKPGLGYWRRKQLGFNVKRTPLPVAKKNLVAISRIPVNRPEKQPMPEQFKSALNPALVTTTRHPTIKQTAQAFEKGSPDQFGRLDPSDWRLPRFDLRVTKSGLQRALAFMDELVKLTAANGIETKVNPSDEARFVHFNVDGEQIRITVREGVRGRKRDLTPDERRDHERYPTIYRRTFRYVYDPTGRLTVAIDNYSDAQRTWTDTKKQKIEEHPHEIVFAMRAAAAYEKRMRVEREAEQARRAQEERRRWKQQERIERLKRNVASWEEAERIRGYLATVRKKAEDQEGGLQSDSLIARFLAWGERYADGLDPSSNAAAADWADDV